MRPAGVTIDWGAAAPRWRGGDAAHHDIGRSHHFLATRVRRGARTRRRREPVVSEGGRRAERTSVPFVSERRPEKWRRWKWQGEKGGPFGHVKRDPSVGWSSRRLRTERSDGRRRRDGCPSTRFLLSSVGRLVPLGGLETVAVPVGRQHGGMVHDAVDDGRVQDAESGAGIDGAPVIIGAEKLKGFAEQWPKRVDRAAARRTQFLSEASRPSTSTATRFTTVTPWYFVRS